MCGRFLMIGILPEREIARKEDGRGPRLRGTSFSCRGRRHAENAGWIEDLRPNLSPWLILPTKKPRFLVRRIGAKLLSVAEREGFEPSVEVYPLHSLSRRAPSADSAISPGYLHLAEGVGFEPTVPLLTEQRFSRPPP